MLDFIVEEWQVTWQLCNIKPLGGGGVPKIRGLGCGGSQVWPHILGMSPSLGWVLLIICHEVNLIVNT